MKVYVCGIEYDDFGDGGFAVIGICDSLEKAQALIQENPNLKKCDTSIRIAEINKYYENIIGEEEE